MKLSGKVLKVGIIAIVIALINILILLKINRDGLQQERLVSDHAYNWAKTTYQNNCIMCHGPYGEGNGATARHFPVKPPNFTNKNWQLSVSDFGIRFAIINGSKASGRSDFMPSHPEYADQEGLDGLVVLVREFGRR